MKKRYLIWFCLMVVMLLGTNVLADEVILKYRDSAHTIVSGYSYDGNALVENVDIPAQVVEIESDAFAGFSRLGGVTFHEGLKKIGQNAFKGTNLYVVDFPSTLETVGYWAFSKCPMLSTVDMSKCERMSCAYAFTDCPQLCFICFPEHMAYLSSAYSFENCYPSLKNVTMPKTIDQVDVTNSMFSGCKNLESIHFPDNFPTFHASQMFEGCTGLKTLTLPATMTSTSYAMFQDCTGLTTVDAPGLYSVSSSSFAGCTSLTSIDLTHSNGRVSISANAFNGCEKLQYIRVKNAPANTSFELTSASSAFEGCQALTGLNYPVTGNVAASCFKNSGITGILLPPQCQNIGEDAFAGTNVLISGWIGSYADSYAKSNGFSFNTVSTSGKLTVKSASASSISFNYEHSGIVGPTSYRLDLYLDNNKVGSGSYSQWSETGTVSTNTKISMVSGKTYAFTVKAYTTWNDTDGAEHTVTIGSCKFNYKYEEPAVDDGGATKEPETEKSGSSAGSADQPSTGAGSSTSSSSITVGALKYSLSGSSATVIAPKQKTAAKLIIPATVKVSGKTYKVTAIKANAFKGMKKLSSVTIGKNVKTIGKNAFLSCVKLKTVKGMAAVTTISDAAFKGCKILPGITLPAKVKKIGKNAFYGCAKLKTITIKTTKLTTKTVGANAFIGIYKKATIKVPAAKLKVYKTLLLKKGVAKTAKFKKG